MNRQQQDLAWQSAPQEFREQVKKMVSDKGNYTTEQRAVIRLLYGDENLFSDTEPDEMLMVSKSKVTELYNIGWELLDSDIEKPNDIILRFSRGIRFALKKLFGGKCLPDKEESVQAEPKFRKGDKVISKLDNNRICTVEYQSPITKLYQLDTGGRAVIHREEQYLEPYTEPKPKFKIGDKVYQTVGHNRLDEYTIKKVYTDKSRGIVYDIQGLIGIIGIEENKLCLTCQNPYTEPETTRKETQKLSFSDKQNTDNMEEKELNLCELLKGCVGEWFYVTPCGEMELKEINKLELKPLHFSRDAINCLTKTDGRAYENGTCIIYPSRALYEKYPLDAYSAWMEWKEERKPRYKFEVYLSGYDNGVMMADIAVKEQFQFKTYEEIMQAAEAVRETLIKIHESLSQSK